MGINKTRSTSTGIIARRGVACPVWHVHTDWTASNGRKMHATETFDTEAEANSWLKWA